MSLLLKNLESLQKKYFPNNAAGYEYISKEIMDVLGDRRSYYYVPSDVVWLLMTTTVIEGTRDKLSYQQKEFVDELSKIAQVDYSIPTTLEAVTCILAEYSHSKKRLFNDSPFIYTHCQERVYETQVIVGSFTSGSLSIRCINPSNIGVAALRKFVSR